MNEVVDLAALYQKISAIGFTGALFFALGGSFMGLWVWGKVYRTDIAKKDADLIAMKAERDVWINRYMELSGALGKAVNVASNAVNKSGD